MAPAYFCHVSSIYAPSRSYLWGMVWGMVTVNDVTGTGNEREIISRVFPPYFPRFLGTPLDSRYEQWNFDSNQSYPVLLRIQKQPIVTLSIFESHLSSTSNRVFINLNNLC